MQAVAQSLSDGLGAILGALPALIGAILILVVGFIIAKVCRASSPGSSRAWASRAGWRAGA
jgi:hypothetical protein